MFTVLIRDILSGSVMMPETTYRQLGSPGSITLHFGHFKKTMAVALDDKLEPGTVLVPAKLSELLTIPDLPYEARLKGRDLHLGPVIGFMNHEKFYDNPHWIATRFAKYSEVKGLIFIFSEGRVDTRRKIIRGKYYDPGSASFIQARVPYPDAVYLRTNPSAKLYRQFKALLGAHRIYNYPHRSNKREFWRCASKFPQVMLHIPETIEYVSMESALAMLYKHGVVYLKPTNLSRGRGIYRLSIEKRGYVLTDINGRTWTAWEDSALEELLRDKLRRQYLVQQEIPFTYQGHKVDFRIYLQKNSKKVWEYRWMDTKVSIPGSIISNHSNRYKILPGEEGMHWAFGMDQRSAGRKIREATEICIQALKTLEDNGHSLGDVAIDFVLDRNQKIWLLEVQTDYFGDVFREDYQAGYMHPHSFDYAKALAGF